MSTLPDPERRTGMTPPPCLTPAMARVLTALHEAAPDYRITTNQYRRVCGVSQRFRGTLTNRMLDASLMVRTDDGFSLTITGKRALDAHRLARG